MRNFIKNSLGFVLGTLVTILVFEGYLRGTEIKLLYKKFDTIYGSSYKPNCNIHINKENLFIGKTNKYGFLSNNPKPGNYTIAVYGDSFTEAFQVKEENNFCNVLQNQCNKNKDYTTSVLNFGISNVLLKDIYIRKATLGQQFTTHLNIYMVDNFQFINYPNGTFNGLELKIQNNKIIPIPNTQKSFVWYSHLSPFIENSCYLNLGIDMALVLKREGLPLFTTNKNEKKIFENTSQNTTAYYKNMPEINSKIVEAISKENSVFVFREHAEPPIKKLLQDYKVPYYEGKPILDRLRKKGKDPYYWKNTNVVGHFTAEAHEAFGKFLYTITKKHKKSH